MYFGTGFDLICNSKYRVQINLSYARVCSPICLLSKLDICMFDIKILGTSNFYLLFFLFSFFFFSFCSFIYPGHGINSGDHDAAAVV